LIVLVGYGFYKFVYTKQNQKIAELKVSRDTYSQKWEQVKAKIASKDKKNEQYKILNAKILSKTDKLFPSIKQEEIIVILDRMLEDSKLQGDILGFAEVSIENLSEDKSKNESASAKDKDINKSAINELDKLVSDFNGTTKKDTNSEKAKDSKVEKSAADTTSADKGTTKIDDPKVASVYKMQVTLNFKGTYDELISFIRQVENYDKKIIISNINLAAAEGSGVSGNLILEFYAVPKLNNNDDFKWDYKKPNGKENPFVGGSSEAVSIIKPVEKGISSFDFEMTSKPSSSDLPTVILGKSKDTNRNTYVYGDNDGIEEVKINLVENSGKYYFKYNTSSNVYPEGNNIGEEFSPTGDSINLIVYPTKRNSKEDLSGVNLKISNGTKKKVFVKILGDDKERPRVSVISEKGEVNQER
jgi:type IV pilus assembly protein PilO